MTEQQISYKREWARKLWHLSSIWIPIYACWAGRGMALWTLGGLAALSLAAEFARRRSKAFGEFFDRRMGFIMRDHERAAPGKRPAATGTTWLLLASTLALALFALPVAVAAIAMLVVCDSAAALVGRRFGRVRFGAKRKSLEGSAAFFLSGLLVAWLTPGLPLAVGAAGALSAMFAEALLDAIDDNFSIPLAAGAGMSLAQAVL